MINTKDMQSKKLNYDNNQELAFTLTNLKEFDGISDKLQMYSLVEVEVGKQVEYHVHEGNAENYYILSGKALYNDNGVESVLEAGSVTYTPSGQGHGIKNIGDDKLYFMALIIKN